MAETLDQAVAEAKIAAGLLPDEKYPTHTYCSEIEGKWQRPFWETILSNVAASDPLLHDFLPVRGHPDDDECTFRSDGTDATYCGRPQNEHLRPQPWDDDPEGQS